MTKDIIILGAGASKAEGAPTQDQLIKEFFSQYGPSDDRKIWHNKIFKFFKNFFGIQYNEDINRLDFPTFEEVLGLLELAIKREEYFGKHIMTIKSLMAIRKNLIFLIAKVIKDSLSSHENHHHNLILRLKNENLLDTTSFISLNYDIIIDNRIHQLGSNYNMNQYKIDYGVEFVNNDEANRNNEIFTKPIKLYKLHGSLNWLYCHSCISLKLTEQQKGGSMTVEKDIPCANRDCHANYQLLIIPPTFFKVMSNYYLSQIWYKAELTLREAERIFFCGYSFPDADIHIKYLLKRAELYKKHSPEVYIINWHDEKTNERIEDEKKRFLRFFKDKSQVHYKKLSFEEFSIKGIKNY